MTGTPRPRAERASAQAPPRAQDREWRGYVPPAERRRLRAAVGAVLWRERLVLGLDQRTLAERSGLSLSSVERLESGTQRPSDASTGKLARALRADRCEAAMVELDLELQRAAGESLRRVRRHRSRWTRLAVEVTRERPPEASGWDVAVREALAGLGADEGSRDSVVPDGPRTHRVDRERARAHGGRRAAG